MLKQWDDRGKRLPVRIVEEPAKPQEADDHPRIGRHGAKQTASRLIRHFARSQRAPIAQSPSFARSHASFR